MDRDGRWGVQPPQRGNGFVFGLTQEEADNCQKIIVQAAEILGWFDIPVTEAELQGLIETSRKQSQSK